MKKVVFRKLEDYVNILRAGDISGKTDEKPSSPFRIVTGRFDQEIAFV